MVSRRALLGGAAGVVGAAGLGAVLVETEVLPGRGAVHRKLGWTGPETPVPKTKPGRSAGGTFTSRARGNRKVSWRASYPPGMVATAQLPVAIALHSRGRDHRFAFDDLGADRYLAQVTAFAVQPFVVVSVDGGPDSYWHERENADDPPRMIRDELLPVLADRGLQTDRIGLIGWSMGGYGALLFAEHFPAQVVAVAAVSPALWRDPEDAADGAFDGASDFRRHDVFRRSSALRSVDVRVDCGDVDPFVDTVEEFRDRLEPKPGGHISEGGHDVYYWRRAMPGALGFLGDALGNAYAEAP
ncbi:MAG: esterase [Streptosporangiales bacterium]|nr:esterase [Streptosporangiales bacterium]